MAEEDNHFVAHPEGGITTASQVEAEKAEPTATEAVTPEVAHEPEATPAEQPAEDAAPGTPEVEPEPTERTVEPEA